MKMKMKICCLVLLSTLGINGFIIPDELPSILSVIYSNIPTLKKGTDSRIGWGFRLGERADFQVLLELGPQQYTQKLANQGDESGANKRSTLQNLANTLYAQRQQDKKQREQEENETVSKSKSGQWLQNWSKTIKKTEKPSATPTLQNIPLNAKPGLGIGEIDAKSVIPDDSVLELLEKQKLKSTTTRKPIKKTINPKPKKPSPNQSMIEIFTQDKQVPDSSLTTHNSEKPLDEVSLE